VLIGSDESRPVIPRRVGLHQGTLDALCAEALFGQNGLSACWQLRKNPNQGMAL
jgi:hypothetical protein